MNHASRSGRSGPLGANAADSSTGALALPMAITALLAALLLAPGCIIVADGDGGWDGGWDDDGWNDCMDPACTGEEIVDSDGDGVGDDDEGACNTDAYNADSDQDGTLDGDEDLDGDGYSTADEIAFGSNCADGSDNPGSAEGEGEGEPGEGEGEPPPPPPADADADGLSDDQEAERGTDPNSADSDGDGQCDGAEVECGSSPLDPFFTCT